MSANAATIARAMRGRIVFLSLNSVTGAYTCARGLVDRFACESGRVAEYVRIELESGEVVCERCLMATNPRFASEA